jgi:hypothetical protein
MKKITSLKNSQISKENILKFLRNYLNILIFYSITSPIYAAANVAKINA